MSQIAPNTEVLQCLPSRDGVILLLNQQAYLYDNQRILYKLSSKLFFQDLKPGVKKEERHVVPFAYTRLNEQITNEP